MDYQLIASWLGLPPGPWPPDHYTLLGLPPREADEGRIEHHVHERLMRVRSYQLSHPELATEAMKRLAQAFDCLTNPQAKKAYDAAHFPQAAPPPVASARVPTAIAHDTVETAPAPALPVVPAPPPPAVPAPPGSPDWWTQQQPSWKEGAVPPPVRVLEEGPPPMAIPVLEEGPPPMAIPLVVQDPAAPPPVRVPVASAAPAPLPQALPAAPPPVNGNHLPPAPAAAPARVPTGKPVDPVFEAAKSSPVLRNGLATRRGLYERMVWLRHILLAWERAGKHVGKPKKRLTRAGDEVELSRQLETIEELLQEQPSLLGQPGQPGYRVLALGHHEQLAGGFRALDEQQRDLLARDWIAGRTLLRAHGKFLCEQVKRLRRLTGWQRLRRNIDARLTEYRGWILLVLGLVGLLVLVVACWR
jgi:hypothetical protein